MRHRTATTPAKMRLPHIIVTDNFSKAMVLASLGVPLVGISGKPASHGDCPEYRQITSEELEKNGWETVEDAEEAGFEGTIVYGFGEHPDRRAIAKAFDKAHHSTDASETIPDTLEVKDVASGKKVTVKVVELMAAFGAVLFRNRKKFADRRKKVRAKLFLDKGEGTGSVIDRRADMATKERLS
jgi:hypothetical protein